MLNGDLNRLIDLNRGVIESGISVALPVIDNVVWDLTQTRFSRCSLRLGFDFHTQYTKTNDLNAYSSNKLKLYTADLMKPESDIDNVIKEYHIESNNLVLLDLSWPGKFYREEMHERQGGKITTNNLFSNCPDLVHFVIMKPIFDEFRSSEIILT